MRNQSIITANAINKASGGNINIDAGFVIAFPNGNNDIIANAAAGRGGNIDVNAEAVFGIEESLFNDATNDINASSEVDGLDGTIAIIAPNINPVQRITEAPIDLVAPEQTVAQVCQTNQEAVAKNGFTIKGKGGIPSTPDSPLDSRNIVVNGDNTDPISALPEPIETSKAKIQPARGIKITKSEDVILTAYRTNNAGDRLLEIKQNCS